MCARPQQNSITQTQMARLEFHGHYCILSLQDHFLTYHYQLAYIMGDGQATTVTLAWRVKTLLYGLIQKPVTVAYTARSVWVIW